MIKYLSNLNQIDLFQTVYTNSLLAALNAWKMIRIVRGSIQTTSKNELLSEFPKNGTITQMVSFVDIG